MQQNIGRPTDELRPFARRDEIHTSPDGSFFRRIPLYRIDRLRSIGVVLNLRTTSSQKCEAVPRRARVQGSKTCERHNSRLESDKEEKKVENSAIRVTPTVEDFSD